MKTLLFCTAYAESHEVWNDRYKTWYDYYKSSKIVHDKIMIFDDCSPIKPTWITKDNFYTFHTHLGRASGCDYEGWHRSFQAAIFYARDNGFTKIIHAESDAFFLSKKIIEFINSLNNGWHSLWCPRHNFPESALQIICPDKIEEAIKFMLRSYNDFRGNPIEGMFPYNSHKEFIGDRYGEYLDYIPQNADYSMQTSSSMIGKYLNDK